MRIPQENLDFELQRAVSLHQAGRLTEAEPIYRRILRVQKHHPDATHLIAMLMHQKGDTAAALPILDQLLKTRPNFTAAHRPGIAMRSWSMRRSSTRLRRATSTTRSS